MFIPSQTCEGIKISIYSLFEVVKFSLENGASLILTEKFNQVILEEYFGKPCSLGQRKDNSDVYQFGYNSNTIQMQRFVAINTGNGSGSYRNKKKKRWTMNL